MNEQPVDNINVDLSDNAVVEDSPKKSVLRTRIIPAIAGLMVAGLAAILIWSLVAPESARTDTRRQVGRAIVYDDVKPASDFDLATIDGNGSVALADLRGKIVVLNIWASWCAPCRNEMPILAQASTEFPDNVVMLGANVQDTDSDARSFLAEVPVPYTVLDGDPPGNVPISVEYGIVGVPETFLINRNGELVALLRGEFKTVSEVHEFVALAQ